MGRSKKAGLGRAGLPAGGVWRWLAIGGRNAAAAVALCWAGTAAATAQQDVSPQVALVARLYSNYAWEAVIYEPTDLFRGLFKQSARELRKYFVPELVVKILQDRRCAARQGRTCALRFSPHWDGRDPLGASVRVSEGEKPAEVAVAMSFPGGGLPHKLVYLLKPQAGGWRIADIRSVVLDYSLQALFTDWDKRHPKAVR